jgi:hypothetical protein
MLPKSRGSLSISSSTPGSPSSLSSHHYSSSNGSSAVFPLLSSSEHSHPHNLDIHSVKPIRNPDNKAKASGKKRRKTKKTKKTKKVRRF